jgi:hypothetical protein
MIKVSVLLPTRGRPKEFNRAVDSLLTTAENPDSIQILAYVDDDDPKKSEYPITVIVGPRYGYPRLYEAIGNYLIPRAKGDWLLLFNDDAHMMTKTWDTIASRYDNTVLCPQSPQNAHATGINVFPFVPKKWVDLVGWAQNGANDTHWQEIGKMLDRHRNVDIMIEHTPTDSRTQGYDPASFFNLRYYALMGYHAGRIHERYYAK